LEVREPGYRRPGPRFSERCHSSDGREGSRTG
jgi:hypothetical protein